MLLLLLESLFSFFIFRCYGVRFPKPWPSIPQGMYVRSRTQHQKAAYADLYSKLGTSNVRPYGVQPTVPVPIIVGITT